MEKRGPNDAAPSEPISDDPTERHLSNAREQLRRALERFEAKLPNNDDESKEQPG